MLHSHRPSKGSMCPYCCMRCLVGDGQLRSTGFEVFSSASKRDPNYPVMRKSRPGPEEEMVVDFLENLEVRLPAGCKLTLFKEPRLESGIPDIVAVVWNERGFEKWHPNRTNLRPADLRLLHLLSVHGPWRRADLLQLLGMGCSRSLSRLEEADVIDVNSRSARAKPRKSIFAVKRIYAIEAKVSQVPAVVEQAAINFWFAQSSNVLLPKFPRNSAAVTRATDLGIGIWSAEEKVFDATQPDPSDGFPVSYASWLFNEWIGNSVAGCAPQS